MGTNLKGDGGPSDPASGNPKMEPGTPGIVLPPTWVDATGRVYLPPPIPFFGPTAYNTMIPVYQFIIPHPSIVDLPIIILGNLPLPPPLPPRDINAPRGPSPANNLLRILTGSVNQIMSWPEIVNNFPVIEVTGILFAIGMLNPSYLPAPGNEINLLLRDVRDSGPILRVIHPYHLYSEMPQGIQIGQILRCTGKILDAQRMLALKITLVLPLEINNTMTTE